MTKPYEGVKELKTKYGKLKDQLVPYYACSTCHGVFDHNKIGKEEAKECCSEHMPKKRRNPYGNAEAAYVVLDDDDTFGAAKDSKIVVILDLDSLLELNEEYDPDQDHGMRNIIKDRENLEKQELVRLIDIRELLQAYGVNLPDDDEQDGIY